MKLRLNRFNYQLAITKYATDTKKGTTSQYTTGSQGQSHPVHTANQ
jgi:hypothetical protein